MKKIKYNIAITSIFVFIAVSGVIISCTKYGSGFISPDMQYAVNQFSITRGRQSVSYSLVTDGSSVPMTVKWTHIYDSTGNIVDDLFEKTYPVAIWTQVYDSKADTTYASIMAKQAVQEMQPININPTSGVLEANAGSYYLPLGNYSMDLQVTNSAGTEILKNIISIDIVDGLPLETAPEQGAFSLSLLIANTASGAGSAGGPNGGVMFNGVNNPFVDYTVTRFADTPNVLILKIMDRNGVPFNAGKGEIAKRPNSGINPTPPFLQNLQDYAPDTYQVSDSAISIKFPLVPFPITSLGNGYNMYYRIPTQYVHIDSTSAWTSNTAGNFYKGASDSHYLGVYTDGLFDYAVRVPMRVWVPGSYEIAIKLLDATHR
jgi:hypothetical protein